jgi:hypothetical protein
VALCINLVAMSLSSQTVLRTLSLLANLLMGLYAWLSSMDLDESKSL